MKVLKYLVPLVVIATVTMGFVQISPKKNIYFLNTNNPLNLPNKIGTGVVAVKHAGNDSMIVDTVNVGDNDVFAYGGDSLVGALLVITSGASLGDIRYIRDIQDTAECPSVANSYCSLYVHKAFSAVIESLVTYDVYAYLRWPNIENYGRFGDDLGSYIGWEIAADTTNDTTYSEAISWDEGLYGDKYKFTYRCIAETTALMIDEPCSTNIRIWFEISHDGENWDVPDGYTTIIPNLADYTFHSKEVILPLGTPEFRIGIVGNGTNHNGRKGMNWLSQWLLMPGK